MRRQSSRKFWDHILILRGFASMTMHAPNSKPINYSVNCHMTQNILYLLLWVCGGILLSNLSATDRKVNTCASEGGVSTKKKCIIFWNISAENILFLLSLNLNFTTTYSVRRFIAKISGAIIVVVLLILSIWVKRISIIKLIIFNVWRRSRWLKHS